MLRLLLLCACLGALEAAAVEVHETSKSTGGNSSPISLLLENSKANGIQMFIGNVAVGTPPQVMSAVFDTQHALSYFPSIKCEDPGCKMRKRYDSSISSTYKEDGTPFTLPGQNISGFLSTDSLHVAGNTVASQTFGEGTSDNNTFDQMTRNDGTLGLGFGNDTLLTSMVNQGLIPEQVFGLWLGRDPQGGELSLGAVNKDLYSGEMTWANIVNSAASWTVMADSIALDGHPEAALCPDGCSVIMASTTPYFMVSLERAKAISDILGGTAVPNTPGFYFLDCATLSGLPTMQIKIGGRMMEMTPQQYTFVLTFGGQQLCASGFFGLPALTDQWLFGTLFMQQFYTAYDVENGRVGFADSV
ncbi:aspartic proteinase A3-like [Pollicipes pollicipes]|uniref:aspartic proteinase A3-like n=1 Tax=Pollicipes pollicipes TaxID=41117 RepID=UPI001885271C|nr:aspartic proteinase A3-like [Pollicipes pollicipes]